MGSGICHFQFDLEQRFWEVLACSVSFNCSVIFTKPEMSWYFFCLPWVNMIRSHRWLSHSLFLSNFLPASLILNNPLQFFSLVMGVVRMKLLLGVTGLAHNCVHNWKGLKAVWWQGYIISDPSVTGTQTSWSSLPSSKPYCLCPPLSVLSSVSQMTSNPTCLPVSSVLT